MHTILSTLAWVLTTVVAACAVFTITAAACAIAATWPSVRERRRKEGAHVMSRVRRWLRSGSWPATITSHALVLVLVLLSPVLIPVLWVAYFVLKACYGVLDWYEARRGDDLAREMRWQIDSQYAHARSLAWRARWAEKLGLHQVAHKMRHDVRQALRMAIKHRRGLDSGAYLRGGRQYPYVEDQCGCTRYCHRAIEP